MWNTCEPYQDDLIVFTIFEEQLARLSHAFERILTVALQKNIEILFIYVREDILEHILSQIGMSPDHKKTFTVLYFPQPNTAKPLPCFTTFHSYSRNFLRRIPSIAAGFYTALELKPWLN